MVSIVLLAALAILLYKPVRRAVEVRLYPMEYSQQVTHWANQYGVDAYLVYATIRTESGFNASADSTAGARGLMQMTEETFEWLKGKIAPDEDLDFNSLYQPETAIRFGVYFLSLCLERYGGDVSTAAAAYHSGWGTVDSLLGNAAYTDDGLVLTEFPYSQMGHYVSKINNSYNKYLLLYVEAD